MKQASEKLVIGLTGGIGSGKSLVAQLFSVYGIPFYNSDKEAKSLYSLPRVKNSVIELFGPSVYSKKGLNSQVLSNLVFEDKIKLSKLNQIIHPEVKLHFEKWVDQQKSRFVIKEAAILIESNAYKSCDLIISVSCNEKIRTQRVMNRDNSTLEQVRSRMDNQLSDEERNSYANWVIVNDGKSSVIKQVNTIYIELLKLK